MNIGKIQYNACPSFGATILQSKYLKEAKEYALNEASTEEKYSFYRALEIIKNDKKHKTFQISGAPGSMITLPNKARDWQVKLDGKVIPIKKNKDTIGSIEDGPQALKNIIYYARKYHHSEWDKYRRECVPDYHRVKDELKAFKKSGKNHNSPEYRRLKEECQAAKDYADGYFNIKIEELLGN